MPGLDIAEQRSWQNFLETAVRLFGTLNRAVADQHNLTLVDLRLLETLNSSEGGAARMGDLADRLLALPSRVTRQIRRLETAGLVRRAASPDDGRGVLAAITAEGRSLVAAAMVTYAEGVRVHYLGPLTRPQMSALGENCRRISTAMTSKAGTPGPGRT